MSSRGPRLDEEELRKLLQAVEKVERVVSPSGEPSFFVAEEGALEDAVKLPTADSRLISYLLARATRVLEMMEWIRTGVLSTLG